MYDILEQAILVYKKIIKTNLWHNFIFSLSKNRNYSIVEIETDENHMHFLRQSISRLFLMEIGRTIKSITAKEIFRLCSYVTKKLWGGYLWITGYFVSTVGKYDNEEQIKNYVRS